MSPGVPRETPRVDPPTHAHPLLHGERRRSRDQLVIIQGKLNALGQAILVYLSRAISEIHRYFDIYICLSDH